jgi:cytochrome c551/c552
VESSRGIANELISQLGQKLKGAIASDGPVAAVSVCKETAPAIAKSLSARHGALVSRVGTRARNANMGVPNAWQKDALGDFDARLAKGEKPADLEYWKVVDMGNGQRELRYAKAIVTQQLCVTCHGKAEDIPAPLLEKIRAEYPRDQATGYSVGQLRGAVVVAQPLDPD